MTSPTLPIRVDQLQLGNVVRVQLANGFVIDLRQGGAVASRILVGRPYRKTRFVGMVMSLDLAHRSFSVDTQDLTTDQHSVLSLRLEQISVLELQVPGTYVSDNVHRLRIPHYVLVLFN